MGRVIASKTFEHAEGLTCCYRNWASENRSRFLHGMKLHIRIIFEMISLGADGSSIEDVDFSPVRDWLHDNFDHTTCVAENDPKMGMFMTMHSRSIVDLRVMPAVGPEKFAEMTWHRINGWLKETGLDQRMMLKTVEFKEQEGFSALYVA